MDIREFILKEMKGNNIHVLKVKEFDITAISEGTFSPKYCMKFIMKNGEEKSIRLTFNSELIHDLASVGISATGNLDDFGKHLKREITLNNLLGDE